MQWWIIVLVAEALVVYWLCFSYKANKNDNFLQQFDPGNTLYYKFTTKYECDKCKNVKVICCRKFRIITAPNKEITYKEVKPICFCPRCENKIKKVN